MTKKGLHNLKEFYSIINQSKAAKSQLLSQLLNSGSISTPDIAQLKTTLSLLKCIPKQAPLKSVPLDLSYEISELERDILFLEKGEKNVLNHLKGNTTAFSNNIQKIIHYFNKKPPIDYFITDRDGTINNYCARYLSAVQSIYNAYFIGQFMKKNTKLSIILTSAPLDHNGLIDISLLPSHWTIHAGSKGREYFDLHHQRHQFPIPIDQQNKLNQLNHCLQDLVQLPEYELFQYIGSGLQLKFGQTTIARQDIAHSIATAQSNHLLQTIERIIFEIDPDRQYFRIEDTGKDIEIILTIQDKDDHQTLREFDKGDGVLFLFHELQLHNNAHILICGDTPSDIPMIRAANTISNQVSSLFVTQDDNLKHQVSKLCPHVLFVDSPDQLVYTLYQLTQRS